MSHATDLQRIIDSGAKDISSNFFDFVESTLSATDWDLFEQYIETGNFDYAAELIQWSDYAPGAAIGGVLGAAATRNSDHLAGLTGAKIRYDLTNPLALDWIEDHGAELVADIGEGAKRDLREVIFRGYFEGYTPRQQAKYIKDLVGLDERRLKAVDNYAKKLQKKGLSNTEIHQKATRYSEKLLKKRAKTIAVNEASEAATRGQYFSTKDACNRGIMDPHEWEGFRIVTPDERLCDKCAPLEGEARSLPDGVYPSTGSVTTKVHVLCRCTEGYRKITMKEVTMKQKSGIKEAVSSHTEVVLEAKGVKETETSIMVPTVPMVEGVFDGHGFPTLRLYEEFKPYVNWFEGLRVVPNHEPIDPDVRSIGQMHDPKAEDSKRRARTTTEFFKIDLTQREADQLRSKKPSHGSLSFSCYMDYEGGEWNGQHYDAIERGPYVFYEYSMVRNGVVTPEDGAGFHVEKSQSQSPAHRADKRGLNMGDKTDPGHEPGITEEAVKPLIAEAVEAAKAELTEKYETKIKELEAKEKARDLLAFTESLKPGHQTEAADLYEALLKDPIGWIRENADKLALPVDEKQLKGKTVTEGATDSVAAAKQRADDKLLKRDRSG